MIVDDLQHFLESGIKFREGMSGPAIMTIQAALLSLGFNPRGLDGKFGPNTRAAVVAFQRAYDIGLTGELGNQTMTKLLEMISKPGASVQKQSATNQKLIEYFSVRENYDVVIGDVMGWFGTMSNGCAAVCSTALRHIGVNVPHTDLNGYNISLVAQTLAEWLEMKGWVKNTDSHKIMAGDIIVTQDNPEYPGFAAHIWVTASVCDSDGRGRAIDNQAFMYSRNITAPGPKTPWHYSLRAPT